MSRRRGFSAEVYGSERIDILQNLFARRLSPQSAAEALASKSLSESTLEGLSKSSLEVGLTKTWEIILVAARELPEHQEKLVDLLCGFHDCRQREMSKENSLCCMACESGMSCLLLAGKSTMNGTVRSPSRALIRCTQGI